MRVSSKVLSLVAGAALLPGASAFALSNFTAADVSALTNDTTSTLIHTVAMGADYRAYMPATPLGLAIGLDVGIDITLISMPTDFVNTLSQISGQAASSVPTLIPVPKLNIHKGLPLGIDLGFSFATSKLLLGQSDLFSVYGGEIKWAFINNAVLPTLAARLSGTYSTLWFMSTHTYAIDGIVSKNLFLTDPYVGAGLKFWSGDVNINLPIAQGFSAGVNSHQSGVSPHVFGGIPLKLVFMKITPEMDYNFSGILSYGTKVSIGF